MTLSTALTRSSWLVPISTCLADKDGRRTGDSSDVTFGKGSVQICSLKVGIAEIGLPHISLVELLTFQILIAEILAREGCSQACTGLGTALRARLCPAQD